MKSTAITDSLKEIQQNIYDSVAIKKEDFIPNSFLLYSSNIEDEEYYLMRRHRKYFPIQLVLYLAFNDNTPDYMRRAAIRYLDYQLTQYLKKKNE